MYWSNTGWFLLSLVDLDMMIVDTLCLAESRIKLTDDVQTRSTLLQSRDNLFVGASILFFCNPILGATLGLRHNNLSE